MLLKASRITSLTDARYFAAKELDFLGFNLEEGTEGYLDPMYMKAIREWVEGPKIVGEFSRSSVYVVHEAAAFFGLDAVQVSAHMHGDMLKELEGLTVFMDVDLAFDPLVWRELFAQAAPFVAYFVIPIDGQNWPSGKSFLQEICAAFPVLLRSELPATEAVVLLESLQPTGLNFTGGEEEQVGVKSFDELEEVFELLGRN